MSETRTDTPAAPAVDHPAAKLVGTVLAEWDMDVERGKVAEFARATGSQAAEYRAPGAPIPPTFPVTSAFWAPEDLPPLFERLGLDLPQVLHGGQEFTYPKGIPHAGQTLHVVQSVESVTAKHGRRGGAMTVIVLLTEFTVAAGEVVAQSRTTTIERARTA